MSYGSVFIELVCKVSEEVLGGSRKNGMIDLKLQFKYQKIGQSVCSKMS